MANDGQTPGVEAVLKVKALVITSTPSSRSSSPVPEPSASEPAAPPTDAPPSAAPELPAAAPQTATALETLQAELQTLVAGRLEREEEFVKELTDLEATQVERMTEVAETAERAAEIAAEEARFHRQYTDLVDKQTKWRAGIAATIADKERAITGLQTQ